MLKPVLIAFGLCTLSCGSTFDHSLPSLQQDVLNNPPSISSTPQISEINHDENMSTKDNHRVARQRKRPGSHGVGGTRLQWHTHNPPKSDTDENPESIKVTPGVQTPAMPYPGQVSLTGQQENSNQNWANASPWASPDQSGNNNWNNQDVGSQLATDFPSQSFVAQIGTAQVTPPNFNSTSSSNSDVSGIINAPASIGSDRVPPESFSSLLRWHVGIYSKGWAPYMQICGGSLITPNAVISAAHCFWNDLTGLQSAEWFAVAAGKLNRPWNDPVDSYAQKSDIAELIIPPRFQGVRTSFQDDIAYLKLATPFYENLGVKPICVNFDVDLEKKHLQKDNLGTIMGWGLTAENGKPSPYLNFLRLPYVPIDECIRDSEQSFIKYITSDKICAGVRTGKEALCRGDSGGGLVYFSADNTVPYLRGIASTAPNNENLCNAYAVATFTSILAQKNFILEHIPNLEDECQRNFPSASTIGDRSGLTQIQESDDDGNEKINFVCNCFCNNSTSP